MEAAADPKSTVIVGCGIIGCATAYYLSLHDQHRAIHLIDASPVLFENVASGRAGGFLAKDWFSAPVVELGELSFNLHKELAQEFGGREQWGWSQSLSFGSEDGIDDNSGGLGDEWDWLMNDHSRTEGSSLAASGRTRGEVPSWLRSCRDLYLLSEPGTTAQVDPLRLCRFLLQRCISRSNVRLHNPALTTGITTKSKDHTSTHVRIQYQESMDIIDIPCDNLIVTSGPWTTSVLSNLFQDIPLSLLPQITSLSGHSVVLRSKHWPPTTSDPYVCHALFTHHSASGFSPELFSRVGGEIYLSGLNDSGILPPIISAPPTAPRSDYINRLVEVGKKLFRDGDLEIVREGICFRPISSNGNPIIGQVKVASQEGFSVWVASGHGPWGISLSLGTGLVLSQMVKGVSTSVNVGKLAPSMESEL